MTKIDRDLFNRMRQAGLRKQAAETLSAIGEGASKKALQAARTAASDLRLLADEIERRLPDGAPAARTARKSTAGAGTAGGRATRSRALPSRTTGSRAAAGSTSTGRARRQGTERKAAAASRPAPAPTGNGARAPRGQNKAKIMESLKAGPKTASEIAAETGIGSHTVGSTLSKLASAGDVVKAERGYALPT